MIKRAEKEEVLGLLTRNWAVVRSWFAAMKRSYIDQEDFIALRKLNHVYLGLLVSTRSRKLSSNQVMLVRRIVTDLQQSLEKELEELAKQVEKTEEVKSEE